MAKNTRNARRASTRWRKRRRRGSARTNRAGMLRLWDWLLPSALLSGVTRHGNTTWAPEQLVVQALCFCWSAERHLSDAFAHSVRWATTLGGAALTSYQGFMGALGTWSPVLLAELCIAIRLRLEDLGPRFYRVGAWVPIAFDGSRTAVPRTAANERAFCAPNHGQGKTAKYRKKKSKGMRRRNNEKNQPQAPEPQVWLTVLWHVGMRLTWAWRSGPSHASEREHVMDMLGTETFPENTLFVGDAGFVGYPLWSRILDHGHQFLVRAGANVHLLVEGRVGRGRDQQVLSWPQEAQKKGRPPLRLRLVRVRIGKRTRAWLLTSVLDPNQLSAAQMVRLYQMRWGVEVEFRGLKQTLGRAQLRCRNDRRALVELDWVVLGLMVAQLWALKEQLAPRTPPAAGADPQYDPKKRSLAGTMRALRGCLSDLDAICEPGQDVAARLGAATTDDYARTRSKRARYRPSNPDKKPLGEPKIRRLNDQERRARDEIPNLAV